MAMIRDKCGLFYLSTLAIIEKHDSNRTRGFSGRKHPEDVRDELKRLSLY